MALAPYFSRVSDSIGGVTSVTPAQLEELMRDTVIRVSIGERVPDDRALREGALLLVNLLSRLYPRMQMIGAPETVSECLELAHRVNPSIEADAVGSGASESVVTVTYAATGVGADSPGVAVDANGWMALVDQAPERMVEPSPFAALVAACLGAGELFRTVFASSLGGRGRTSPRPGVFALTTADVPASVLTDLTLPPLWLAGAGAIGQACVTALRASGATGHLVVVDPERLELPNLQRYVLSTLSDVGSLKVDLAARALAGTPWTVDSVPTQWGADSRSGPRRETVLVALDSARDRIGVAGGMPRRVYNAWTQPADLGWSRHEKFGAEPCLACLYYPTQVRPSEDEIIGRALRQHRLRILSYFTSRVPVGAPLPVVVSVADVVPPPESSAWTSVSLIQDLVSTGLVREDQIAMWATKSIGQLYSEGVCGGGLLDDVGDVESEVIVPLAQQSALAGVMLAFSAVAANTPELSLHRDVAIESRFDMLGGLPQVLPRPRERTKGCICSDADYLDAATS